MCERKPTGLDHEVENVRAGCVDGGGAETCSGGSVQILLLNKGTTVIILLLRFSRERKAINSERHSGTVPLRPQRENENKGERTRERARGRKMVYKALCFDNGMQAH